VQHSVLSAATCCCVPPACSTIYNMCTQKPPYDYSEQLYQRYKDAFNNYINDMVGPVCVPTDPNILSSSCTTTLFHRCKLQRQVQQI
jgi:hypothetical protein